MACAVAPACAAVDAAAVAFASGARLSAEPSALVTLCAGSTGSWTGLLHTRPTIACTPTSHHNQVCVAAGRRRTPRHSAHTTSTSTAVCTLVAPSFHNTASIRGDMTQSSLRCDCSLATNASSSASSVSLTSARCDIHATNGDTEPCRVFSTNCPTAPRTTSSWPAVAL